MVANNMFTQSLDNASVYGFWPFSFKIAHAQKINNRTIALSVTFTASPKIVSRNLENCKSQKILRLENLVLCDIASKILIKVRGEHLSNHDHSVACSVQWRPYIKQDW